ncbi:1,4-alpha-glucan-branching enzyme 2, chloroplastic/amyloplastic-like [Dorcoceras hygrometricum]|uniref:1,4-alpha-glucan-branching enzyme 2, chloroplastic/amyloplastic-like n=1 Tax=Dorcoceras hygrometricum TaxID=472368 RepID=A0A2Z7D653_9LAMI|nr:1,4-alpha-glucan-branching enzyme 2, chloroplastic/amyloplastic-like [Dorcoceras hygrometricum]
MRIRPPELETSMCDAKYHVSLCAAPPLSNIAAAAAASPPLAGICSGQLFEEFPSVLISSGLLVQADEGVSLLVMDLIDKRPAAEDSAPVIPKKRHTVKGKASLDVVPVAQDVVPLQIIEQIPAATVVKSPAPKSISRKRRLVLPTGSDDEIMDTQEPVKDTDEIAEKHTHEIDDIIRQITAETSKMGLDEKEQEEQRVDETDIGDDFDQWLVESFKDFVVNETGTVVEAESSKVPVVEKDMDKAVGSKHTEEEHMSIDDLLTLGGK